MLVSLPQLEVLAERVTGRSMSNCVAFAPEGETLIVGKLSGKVVVYKRQGRRLRQEALPLARHGRRAQDVEVLPNSPVVITAGSDGLVQFTSWTDRAPISSVHIPGEQLTSLKISPDGAFMAVGDSDASMSLWDLRVMDLFLDPLAQALPAHLSLAQSLVKDADLATPIQHALKFAECILRHRFRYDIEIGEAPTIKAGEFDIEIE
jgi:WD40 repeat protein